MEVGPCDLFYGSFRVKPLNPRLGLFSDGVSRASGTASNDSDSPGSDNNEGIVK